MQRHDDGGPGSGGTFPRLSLYHTTQCAHDTSSGEVYRRLFGRPVVDAGWRLGRQALFTRVGPALLEIMVPNESAVALREFLARFGDSYHSLAFYVDDIDELVRRFGARGIRCTGTAGEPIAPPVAWPSFGGTGPVVFTHPSDTFGMLEFKQRVDVSGGEYEHAPADAVVGPGDPIGVIDVARVVFEVSDVAAAGELWSTLLGAAPCAVLPGRSDLDLQVDGDGRLRVVLLERAERPTNRLVEVAFEVADLEQVREHLAREGFPLLVDDGATIVPDPSATVGVRFAFTASDRAGAPA